MLHYLNTFYLLTKRLFYVIPKELVNLIMDKDLINQPSYYPERSFHKTKLSVFFDQLLEILKYGAPEQFYYMYGFDTMKRGEMNKYMNQSLFWRTLYSTNLESNFNASCILRNKLYFGFFASKLGVKTGNNIALISKGKLLNLNSQSWLSIENFFKEYNGILFCKKLDGECGEGIIMIKVDNQKLISSQGDVIDYISFMNMIGNSTYLLQEKVYQHPEMSKLYPNSLNTLRLVTVKNKKTGIIKAFPSNLRIGAHGSIVDNGSQGGIAVGFDLETGRLYKYGLQKPPYGTKTQKHPDTGVEFSSFIIPFVKEAESQAIFLHSMLDDLYSIGWDIAITESGPLFIEGNDNWEMQAIQRTHGGLKKEFLNALGVKAKKL